MACLLREMNTQSELLWKTNVLHTPEVKLLASLEWWFMYRAFGNETKQDVRKQIFEFIVRNNIISFEEV